jgi:hypothetical protein
VLGASPARKKNQSLFLDAPKISLWLKLFVRGFGPVYWVTYRAPEHDEAQEYFLVYCKIHGFFLDFKRGYKGYFLCPVCREAARY